MNMAGGGDRVIVGLGNPGPHYARNRHNAGFMVVDLLARRLGLEFTARAATWEAARGANLWLVKPLRYMNCSGEALVAWSAAEGVRLSGVDDPEESGAARLLVVCDDLALPLGAVRLRARGSSGGQNGLASIISQLGGPDVPRLRLGIAPTAGSVPAAEWPQYVLSDFGAVEAEAAAEMVAHGASALEYWLTAGLEPTISRFNRRGGPSDAADGG